MTELRQGVWSFPGILPEGVTLAEGIIAAYKPRAVMQAVKDTFSEQKRFMIDAAETSELLDMRLEADIEQSKAINRGAAKYHQQEALYHQHKLLHGSLDEEVANRTRKAMFDHVDKAEAARSRDPRQADRVKDTHEDIVAFEKQRLDEAPRIRELLPNIELSYAINSHYRLLGRRGKIGTFIAGSLLSIGAFIGTSSAVGDMPKPNIPLGQMTEAQYEQYTHEVGQHDIDTLLSWLPLGGIAVASWAAGASNNHFARRRAQKRIKDGRAAS